MGTIHEKLNKIQCELKAPKSQFNKFGNYAYRNCEDILTALKEHLKATKTTIVLNDDIKMVGDRIYVKSTATLFDAETGEYVETTAFARESIDKKGMDASQVTAATSSYARKSALNGLFAIDDTKDADEPIKVEAEVVEEPQKTSNEDLDQLRAKVFKLNFYTLPQDAIDKLVNGAKAKKHVLTQDDVDKYIYKLAEKEKEKYANQ